MTRDEIIKRVAAVLMVELHKPIEHFETLIALRLRLTRKIADALTKETDDEQ